VVDLLGRTAGGVDRQTAYAEGALQGAVDDLRRAMPGTRNHALNENAFSLGQLVGGGLLSLERVETSLLEAGRAIGLDDSEIANTVGRAIRDGMAKPRELPEAESGGIVHFGAVPIDAHAASAFAATQTQSRVSDRVLALKSRAILGSQIAPQLDRQYVVKGWLDADTLAVTYGAPGSAKSFFLLDLLRHVVNGEEWRGHRVRQGRVLYIAGEGAVGVMNRLTAAGGMVDGFVFLPALIDLCTNEIDAEAIVELFIEITGHNPDVIAVDTLARAMAGGDENSSQDMGRLIRHCDRLRELTGAHVHLVHHSGKDSSKGGRGSSALLGAVDTEIHVERVDGHEGEVRVATITKQKDGAEGLRAAFTLEGVPLGEDQDGDAVTSARVLHCEPPDRKSKPRSAQQARVLEALDQFVSECGQPNPGGAGWPEVGARNTVDLKAFKEFARAKEPDADELETKRLTRRIRDVLDKLHGAGLVQINEGRIWRV